MSLSGRTFTINENPSITYALCRIAVNFTDGTSSYSCFECDTVAIYYHPDLSGTAGPPIVVYENSEWQNISYRTITFTSEATEFVLGDDISNQAQFEAWLAENATEEGVEPEPVSNPVSVSKLLLGPKVMGGSSSSAAGQSGLAPAPAAGDHEKFLRGDGTWNNAPNELPAVTSSDNGKALVVIEGNWGVGNVDWGDIADKPTFSGGTTTLSWGTTSTIANVGGNEVKVTMPANPNTDHYAWADITDKPDSATRWPAWSEVTDKPTIWYSGNNNWWEAPAKQPTAYKYEGQNTTTYKLPNAYCIVYVLKESTSRGVAFAIQWNSGGNNKRRMWISSLHDDTGQNQFTAWTEITSEAISTFDTGYQVHTATTTLGNTFTIPVSRPMIYLGGSGTRWMKMGTFVAGKGESIYIIWQTGAGYNGDLYQNSIFEIYMKCWNHATQSVSNHAFGVTIYARNRNGAVFKPVVTAYNTVELWVYLPNWYSTGVFTYQKCGGTWTTSGATQSTEPSGTSANMEYRDLVDSVNISSYRTFAYSSGSVAGDGTQATIPYPSGYTVANTMPIGCFLLTSGTRHDVTSVEVEYLDSSGIHVVNYGASSGQIAVALMKY